MRSGPVPAPEPSPGWQHQGHADASGETRIARYTVEPGFTLVRSQVRGHRTRRESSQRPPGERLLIITYGLSGTSSFHERRGHRPRFQAGFTTVTGFDDVDGERVFPPQQEIGQLRLILTEQALAGYVGRRQTATLLQAGAPPRTLDFSATDRASQGHVAALYRAPERPPPHALALKTTALTLLGEPLQRLLERHGDTQPHALEKVERADALLRDALDQPLCLTTLAARVGLGERQLRRGFQRVFGVSPRQRFQRLRLEYARQLLAGGAPVSGVAYRLGYAHPANFTAAYRRHFGQPPKYSRR
ncbi:AraC family transcriptional regulator [Alloalcanivorax gelatiniphagus]|uniref:Helix-turn-helix transcriptional regulator n=1 Tax=Alloalcanivorax gelatiniphagus TaxID=1194167 RepID=A0ABY2XG59_9GAMM|nr:AraC family transcriptional regulator [Alloalcanivorax gelatiniphagus]TMW10593.1 helix-turn-helix transcriptional regulator [Alloalcanivorax gelatiniphagus]|tara:strand:- start:13654 stop:14562 length:909 start_codon:yes stop_codon:yes gene_type:complete